jgi:hypothetical protein
MKLTNQENKILIEIFKASNGLFLFTLHRQLNISPKDLFLSVENLKSYGLINVNDDRVTLTTKGVDYSTKTTLNIKTEKTNQKIIKEDFMGKIININEFYIPRNFEK